MPVVIDPHLIFNMKGIKSLEDLDLNMDGVIDVQDCPYPYGTQAAKKWFYNYLDPYTKSQITDEMRDQYGDAITGVYKGKLLIKGPGPNQGDFDYLVDKIRCTQGLALDSARRIAGKVLYMKVAPKYNS